MRNRRAWSAIVGIGLLLWAVTLRAQAVPKIVGLWKLNTEKSGVAPLPAGWFEMRQYSLRPDGYLVGLLMTSNARGYHYLQFTAKSDGKEYPEYTDDVLADLIAAAKPTIRTYAEMVIDDYVTEWTDRVNGAITGSGRKIISSDGKTLTVTVNGSSQLRVYDRQ